MAKYGYSRVEYKAYGNAVMVHVPGKKMNRASSGIHNNRLVNNWLLPPPVPIPAFVVEKQFIITLIDGRVDNHTFRSLCL
jgi:hypothetical protein